MYEHAAAVKGWHAYYSTKIGPALPARIWLAKRTKEGASVQQIAREIGVTVPAVWRQTTKGRAYVNRYKVRVVEVL